MVGMARARVCGRSKCVARIVGCQCPLVVAVLCLAPGRASLRGDPGALGIDPRHYWPVLADQPRRGVVAVAVSCVGIVRICSHTRNLAAQPRAVGVRSKRMRSNYSVKRMSYSVLRTLSVAVYLEH